jgi:dTDP-4-amino-4,6-dideoxygalactose transaminase
MDVPWLDGAFEYRALRDEMDLVVRRILESGQYELGEEVYAFEREFAAYCGRKYGVAVGSGSDAIFLTLQAIGVGPGDEVISVANSCYSVALAIVRSGGHLVLADIEKGSCNIDPRDLERRIGPRTRAVVALHGYGIPCDIQAVVEVARRHDTMVIEDGSVSAGAVVGGSRVGSFGPVSVFSLGPAKVLTSVVPGAGIVVTDSQALASKVRILSHYGQRELRASDCVPPAYRQTGIVCGEQGCNSHLGSLQASLLRIKLRQLDGWLETRRERARLYERLLQDLPAMTLRVPDDTKAVYRGYLIRVPDRDRVYRQLRSRGIDARLLYLPPVHLQPAFDYLGYGEGDFPETEKLCREMISLPLSSGHSVSQVKRVVQELRSCLQPGSGMDRSSEER